MSRKHVFIAAGLAVFAIAAACLYYFDFRRSEVAGASSPELLSEIPAGSSSLLYIDLEALRASGFYQHRPNHAPITVPDSNYADFIRQTGFDFEKDLDRAVIASLPQSGPESGPQSGSSGRRKTMILAEGRFDRQKIHDYAMRTGKLDKQDGRDVFLFPTENPKGWNSLVFLDDHRVAIAEGSSIAPVLALRPADSAAGPASDPARQRIARIAGAAVIAVSRVPDIPDNFAPGGMQSAQLVNMLRSVQWITLAALPQGDNLRVSLEGECKTDTDARQLKSTIDVMRLIGQAALDTPKNRKQMDPATLSVILTLLKTADVTASGERVRILMELTPDILSLSNNQNKQAAQ